MSEFNAVGEGGLNDLLQRRLSVAGGPPSPTVEPAVFPALVLENDRVEWGYLKGEMRYSAGGSLAAGGALTRSSVQLINTTPGNIVTVERAEMAATGSIFCLAKLVFYGAGLLPVGANRTSVALDSRLRGGASGCRVWEDNTLGAAGGSNLSLSLTGVFPGNPILLPGWALWLAPTSDNVAITGYTIQWRERQAEPRELV